MLLNGVQAVLTLIKSTCLERVYVISISGNYSI
ncbi:unnamed protein product, partial [Rotaria socialis]